MPDAPTPDQVAAHLARMRENGLSWPDDVERLLAAVEAVLELADEWDQSAIQLDEMAGRAAARGAAGFRTETMGTQAQAYRDHAKALREAISAALLGEEKAGG